MHISKEVQKEHSYHYCVNLVGMKYTLTMYFNNEEWNKMALPTCTIFIYVIDSGIVNDLWTPTIELKKKWCPIMFL
jgi:hypothetical protein